VISYNLEIDMTTQAVEEIVVLGNANALVDVAAGPSATFGTFEMETSVAFDRDIKDVYIIDPRMNLDGDSQVNCVGQAPTLQQHQPRRRKPERPLWS
jgi:hypothetical protein